MVVVLRYYRLVNLESDVPVKHCCTPSFPGKGVSLQLSQITEMSLEDTFGLHEELLVASQYLTGRDISDVSSSFCEC